jgi:HEXXH motif-containing protein
MSLLDAAALGRLHNEFRRSMRKLLVDLCADLDHYSGLAERLRVPTRYFRFLTHAFPGAAYSNWKVAGWIEALNDLVYFLDVLTQIRRERELQAFAEQLFAESQRQFFEHSYADELFPHGHADGKGLARRVQALCGRLAREITQESLFFDPRWPLQWLRRERRRMWKISGSLDPSFERAEPGATVAIGIEGTALVAPPVVRRTVARTSSRAIFVVTQDAIALDIGRSVSICAVEQDRMRWDWPRQEPAKAIVTRVGPVSVGPTLCYGADREPNAVSATGSDVVSRIARAWETISQAWPEGHGALEQLTSRIIPLKAKGVVSFSYRHRPGLSFVNCFDRDDLDLIDDLVHENSHHHLNLLLRKHVLYRGDDNQQIFYSPWRKTLRPLRGILHAAFTFTMGALLFERLSAWAETKQGLTRWRKAGLTRKQLLRARFRCFEEIESVRYSIYDLHYAGRHLNWLTSRGAQLVHVLHTAIEGAERNMSRHRKAVLGSALGPQLIKHIEALGRARRTYDLTTPR